MCDRWEKHVRTKRVQDRAGRRGAAIPGDQVEQQIRGDYDDTKPTHMTTLSVSQGLRDSQYTGAPIAPVRMFASE